MGFRRVALACVLGAAVAAGCGDGGKTSTIRVRVLAPSDRAADPFAGATRVRVSLLQNGAEIAPTIFELAEDWTVPDAGVNPGQPLQVRIAGLDSGGAIVLDGRTRPIVPRAADRTYGVFLSPAGAFALPPSAINVPRSDAGVLVVEDGRVVVAGGEDAGDVTLSSIEIYDLDDGTWRQIVGLGVAREEPALAELPDGRVLIAGGDDTGGTDLTTCEVLTLPVSATDLGSIAPCADMQSPAHAQGAARLPSGKILVAGGQSALGPPRPSIYDPATNTWSVPATGTRAEGAHVVPLSDGRVALVGGRDVGGVLDRIDVITEEGADVGIASGTLRVKRHLASAIAVTIDGVEEILVTGGSTSDVEQRPTAATELVSLATGSPVSRFLERDLRRRMSRGIARLQGGRVLLAGGRQGDNSDVAQVFDPASRQIELTGDLLDARRARRTTISLPDGTAMLVGGDESTLVEIYQPPAGPLTGANRVDFAITPSFAARAGAADPKEGGATYRARVWDRYSILDELTAPASASTIALPLKVGSAGPDDEVHLTLDLLDANGAIVSWGATGAPLDQAAQSAAAATLQLGRASEFTVAGTLTDSRAASAVARLADGRVAIVGGLSTGTTTELFDPASGSVSSGPPPQTGITYDFGFVVEGTSRLLVVGGRNGGVATAHGATQILDLATGAFVTPAPAAVPTPIRTHSLSLLADGDLLAYGGHDVDSVPVSQAYRRESTTGVWAAIPLPMPDRRAEHEAVTLADGRVLVSGGITSSGTIALSASAVVYDPAGGFTTTGNLVQARRNHAAIARPGAGAIVCGGHATLPPPATMRDTCESWNGTSWTLLADTLTVPRSELAQVRLPSGIVMLIGGGIGDAMAQASTTAVDLLDPVNLTLTAGPPLVFPREEAPALLLPDGRVVVCGGEDDDLGVVLDTVEIYTPPSWRNPFGY